MKDLGNYECEGQMSLKDLMDLIAPVVVDNEPPILLSEGQTVYKVVRRCRRVYRRGKNMGLRRR